MEKVPQIVSQRLKAASSAVGHPDPDVLTAFSEHSLRKAERAAVIEHLARCGECREIVALALPASEERETFRPASEGWLTWPVIRWGFIAAGIIALASFGIMRYQHRVAVVAYLKAPAESTAKEAKNLPPVPPSAVPAEDRDKTTAADSITADRKDLGSTNGPAPSAEMAAPASGGPVQSKRQASGGTLPDGPRVQWQRNTNPQQQAAQSAPAKQLRAIPLQSVPPSANPETVDVESAAGMVSANLDSSAIQNKIDRQALQNGRAETRVERSKPPVTTATTAPMANFPPPASPARTQLTRQIAQANAFTGASILWTISATGTLQRSLDQGTTWQDIDVNSPTSMGGTGVPLMKAPAKANEVIADSPTKKDKSAPLTFRAVASNGADVWAGASGGLLYHSTDAGSHWTRVVPSTSDVSLTGDIVSLEFVDPQHGRVVTSTPEVWTTSDGGQSWQKQ